MLIALGGATGVFLSGDLFELLVFWEVVTFCLYLLIASGGQSGVAATKAFVMTGIGDGALVLAGALIWAGTNSTSIAQISIAGRSWLSVCSFLLVTLAATTKAGALPLHTWLPTCAQYSDASVMAFLPAGIDKLLWIYLLVILVRQILPLGPGGLQLVLACLGSATMIVAAMVALVQHDLKRLLAFHAVSQVGYMILGIARLTPVGILGGVFHMLNNVIYKPCLFLCAGAVERRAGTSQLDRLGGLGRRMPLTFAACILAALAISGIPPLNGFASKWMIYQGIVQMGGKEGGLASQLWPV
ncbi:MAG: proton-conducting transporter membrane subunit [Sedimentisphaerales bacterium]|nr:proton-conducting transporter membrane subunit [Sedimentisphaerales bacterium]